MKSGSFDSQGALLDNSVAWLNLAWISWLVLGAVWLGQSSGAVSPTQVVTVLGGGILIRVGGWLALLEPRSKAAQKLWEDAR